VSESADLIRQAMERLNQGDAYGFLDLYADDIELFVPSWLGTDPGHFTGRDAVNAWYARSFLAQWVDHHWQTREVIEDGSNVIWLGHWTATGKHSGVKAEMDFLTVFTVHDGKIAVIAQLGGFRADLHV
jgi:ketosteroid isomerase-like protein